MRQTATGWMRFGGDLFEPPIIHRSHNGWLYKPDQARTKQEIARGINKAWPRDRYESAETLAGAWMEEYIQRNLDSRKWAIPDAIEKSTNERPFRSGKAFIAQWRTKPWGWVSLELHINDGLHTYRTTTPTLTYKLSGHQAITWWLNQEVDEPWRGGSGVLFNRENRYKKPADMRPDIMKWIADPWGEFCAGEKSDQTDFEKIFQPPREELRNRDFVKDHEIDYQTEDIGFWSTGNARLWREGELRRIMTNDIAWEALQELADAFSFSGYTLRVNKQFDYSADNQPIVGMKFVIDADPEASSPHDRVDHTVNINNDGKISVKCGYVQDESRWIDREKRVAKETMALLEEELSPTEFVIEIDDS